MSVSPAQNFSKPPPVPEVPTVILTPGFSPSKASAAACVKGATVLEPSTLVVPDRSPPPLALALPPSSSSPQAVAPSARAPQATMEMMIFFMPGTLASAAGESVIALWPSCKKDVKRGPLLGGKPVAKAEVRVDVGPARERLVQLLAQPRDVHVDRAVGLAVVLLPDDLVELLAADDAVTPLGERGAQLELANREPKRLSACKHQVLGWADLQFSDDHGRRISHPCTQLPLFRRCAVVKSL